MDQALIGLEQMNFALLGDISGIAHTVLNFGIAAVALGLVIFVHELGHFAVAKMCGVKCEKFFLGFDIAGKKICSFRWGETEYGIGVLPLGGYVKMLGQDDNPTNAAEERERTKLKPAADDSASAHRSGGDLPHEPTAEDHEAFDPRSYMAKSVPKRMAIISAGVIMNLIFAVIFATIAYRCGVAYTPCVVGETVPGDPAWVQDIRPGDRIVQFDNDSPSKHLRYFEDLLPRVLFTGTNNELRLMVYRTSQSPDAGGAKSIEVVVRPTDKADPGGQGIIGVMPAEGNETTKIWATPATPAMPNSPTAKVNPPFECGDRILTATVDGADHAIQNGVQIEALFAQYPDQPIKFSIERAAASGPPAEAKKLDITLAPAPLQDLGLVMQMGPISAVQNDSPAEAAKFHAGDRIESIDGKPVADPMRLPDELRKLAGKEITVQVRRTDAGRETTVALHVTPRVPTDYNRFPSTLDYGCDALGIAYPVLNTVASVQASASAGAKDIQPGDKLVSAEFLLTDEQKKSFADVPVKFETFNFDDDHLLWPELQAIFVQWLPADAKIKLTVKRGDKDISATVNPIVVAGAYYPGRGLILQPMSEIRKADTWVDAGRLGWRETKESVMQIVTTLRKLASGGVSPTKMAGPIGIAAAATASASQGIPKLLIFLTLLSANLAVINFLPIPILDGGHMMFLLYEGIRGKPASERVQMYLTYLGLVFILTLMVFVIGLDLTRLFKWFVSLFS